MTNTDTTRNHTTAANALPEDAWPEDARPEDAVPDEIATRSRAIEGMAVLAGHLDERGHVQLAEAAELAGWATGIRANGP